MLTYADIKKWGLARLSDVAGGAVTSVAGRTGAVVLAQADVTANAPVAITNTTTLTAAAHANRQLIYSGSTATLTISADATGGWTNDDSIEIHTLAASAGVPTLATPDGKSITGSATKIIGAVRKGSGLWTVGTTDPAAAGVAGTTIDMFAGNSLLLLPTGKNVTTWSGIGHGTGPAALGTATARNSSLASLGFINRIGYVSAATAGSLSYLASASAAEISIAPSTSAQFPTQYARVTCAVTDALTSCRTGFGFFSATPTNVEASALPNCAIFGADSTDTNLSLIVNDGTTTTKTALNGGTGFPCNTNGADIYEGYLAFSGGATRTLNYYLINRATGVKVSGAVTANLPAAGTALRVGAYRNNAANAVACSIDVAVIASGGFAQMGATS